MFVQYSLIDIKDGTGQARVQAVVSSGKLKDSNNDYDIENQKKVLVPTIPNYYRAIESSSQYSGRNTRFKNLYVTNTKSNHGEAILQNIATSNIPGDQNCIQCNHMYVATGVQVSLIRNYYFSIVLYLI